MKYRIYHSLYIVVLSLLCGNPNKPVDLAVHSPGMRSIPGGTFTMGLQGVENAVPVHAVTVSSFFMDTTEVTQLDYAELTGLYPSLQNQNRWPVETVTWFDAVLYCNLRSIRDGRDTIYSYSRSIHGLHDTEYLDFNLDSITRANICTGLTGLSIDRSKNGYRLPTEAEWEYACRAGTATKCHWGNDSSRGGDYEWYAQTNRMPIQVASKLPNGFDLYDMAGNVAEWCNDWYDGTYADVGKQIDPSGPDSGDKRVVRGGAYNMLGLTVRSGNRNFESADRFWKFVGFRCVCRD